MDPCARIGSKSTGTYRNKPHAALQRVVVRQTGNNLKAAGYRLVLGKIAWTAEDGSGTLAAEPGRPHDPAHMQRFTVVEILR